jgi:hypothetical protein
MTATCITACFILHNIAKHLKDPEFEVEDNLDENEDEVIPVTLPDNDQHLRQLGRQRRLDIAATLVG